MVVCCHQFSIRSSRKLLCIAKRSEKKNLWPNRIYWAPFASHPIIHKMCKFTGLVQHQWSKYQCIIVNAILFHRNIKDALVSVYADVFWGFVTEFKIQHSRSIFWMLFLSLSFWLVILYHLVSYFLNYSYIFAPYAISLISNKQEPDSKCLNAWL